MSSRVLWSFSDEEGENPTGAPGELEFTIWYEFEQHDYEHAPQLEIIEISCDRVCFDNAPEGPRKPTDKEENELAAWFSRYLDGHPSEVKAIQQRAREDLYWTDEYADTED